MSRSHRVLARFVVPLAVLATVLAASGLTAQSAAAVPAARPAAAAADPVTSVWTENSSVNVFQNDLPKTGASKAISLVLAKNEYESAQVVIRKNQQFTIQQVAFGDLTSGANTLAAANLKYQFVEFEHLDHNTTTDWPPPWPLDNPVRPAPGDFPDALSNNTTLTVPANTTQPIWIRAFAPTSTPAGVYTGTATVVTDAGNTSVPVTVDVKNVAIPNSNDSSFTLSMWMSAFGSLGDDTGDPNAQDTIQQYYGYARYSTDWWALMNNIAVSMTQYRQNDLPIPLVTSLMDGGSTLDAAGTYHFNWTRFDQIVQFFIDRHMVKQLEGFWWYYGIYSDGSAKTEIIARNSAGNPVRTYAPSDGAGVSNWDSQFLPALRDHINAKQWDGMFWMHIADEITDAQVSRYTAAVQTVRTIWPAVRISDANNIESSEEAVAAKESFLIPSLITADANRGFYSSVGKPFWLYTANIPTGSYLNRFIDQPVYAEREMMWYGYQLGATGYLHWAYNNWQFTMAQQSEKGDGWIVKPDPDHHTVKATIREESLRDGIEDWELLKIIGQTKPALAKAFTTALVTTATLYSQDSGFVTRMHNALVVAAAAGGFPPSAPTWRPPAPSPPPARRAVSIQPTRSTPIRPPAGNPRPVGPSGGRSI